MTGALRRGIASTVTAALLCAAAIGPVRTAAAAETTPRPTDRVLELRGHGWGHGRGMSQYGAFGAAARGLTWTQILDFYYPGTRRSSQGGGSVRVWISGDSDSEMRVQGTSGLVLANAGRRVSLREGPAAYRVVRSGSSQELQYWTGSEYKRYEDALAVGANLELSRTSGLLRLVMPGGNRLELRGVLRAVNNGSGLRSVAVMSMDDYLRGVVPNEMPASWNIEALTAQAVAARSYAARLRADAGTRGYDTCDTTACQVFKGTATYAGDGSLLASGEHPRTDRAIELSTGVVLTYTSSSGTAIALTEFSSSNGGWTAAGSLPYQVAKPDPYDGAIPSSVHSWSSSLDVTRFEQAWPSIGTFQRLVIGSRTGHGQWNGRILTASVVGSRTSVAVTGDQLRSALGLRSTWWTANPVDGYPRDWDGDLDADVLAVDPVGGDLRLYPGDGQGSFAEPRTIGHGWQGMNLVLTAGDLDGDGNGDVLARLAESGELWLYSGTGSGPFIGARRIGTGWNGMVQVLSPGDWDGDGLPDLMAAHRDGSLYLYPMDGRGAFKESRRVGSDWQAFDLITSVGDFDGDGQPDLVARLAATGELWLYPGDGDGGFGSRRRIGTGWQNLNSVLGLGDWNGDGHNDILGRTQAGLLYLYTGDGTGAITSGRQVGHGWEGWSLLP